MMRKFFSKWKFGFISLSPFMDSKSRIRSFLYLQLFWFNGWKDFIILDGIQKPLEHYFIYCFLFRFLYLLISSIFISILDLHLYG